MRTRVVLLAVLATVAGSLAAAGTAGASHHATAGTSFKY